MDLKKLSLGLWLCTCALQSMNEVGVPKALLRNYDFRDVSTHDMCPWIRDSAFGSRFCTNELAYEKAKLVFTCQLSNESGQSEGYPKVVIYQMDSKDSSEYFTRHTDSDQCERSNLTIYMACIISSLNERLLGRTFFTIGTRGFESLSVNIEKITIYPYDIFLRGMFEAHIWLMQKVEKFAQERGCTVFSTYDQASFYGLSRMVFNALGYDYYEWHDKSGFHECYIKYL